MNLRKTWLATAMAVVMGFATVGARADLQQMISETQRTEQTKGGFRLIWWIPTEYWRESFKNTSMTPAQADAFCKPLQEYVIVAIADVQMGPLGGATPVSRDQIVSRLSLKIGGGDEVKPLDESQLSPDTKNFLDMMKPAMTNMLGRLGSGLEFICFPAKDASGAPLVDVRKEGMLELTYGDSVYKFRLPLGSLLSPKYDPQTGEKFPGNYVYSPYTGVKLVDSAPQGQ
jgi:hypothetical protein